MMKVIAALAIFLMTVTPAAADTEEMDFDSLKQKYINEVAGALYEPGPKFVNEILTKMRHFGSPDLGMNMTSLTTYYIGTVLFGDEYKFPERDASLRNKTISLAQYVVISRIRNFIANPINLEGLWHQVKAVATPSLMGSVGQTRVNTWLTTAVPLFVEGGFDPAYGKSYEDWRTNGCQWYLQISPDLGYKPLMDEEQCAEHSFVSELVGEAVVGDTTFVNTAHWYGFLWRRYLEGDIGLVKVWQSILNHFSLAARSS